MLRSRLLSLFLSLVLFLFAGPLCGGRTVKQAGAVAKNEFAAAGYALTRQILAESYDPVQVAPGRLRGQLVRRDFVGFSGVTPIAMALEYALGISVKPEGVDWRILLKEPHGVENLAVAGQKVDLAYQDGRVTVKCRAPMRLTINGKAYELVAGEHTLTVESAE